MSKYKILMAASEAFPLVKVGGLADVIGSLPVALNKLNTDTRIILPFYSKIDRSKLKIKKIAENFLVPFSKEEEKINIWQTTLADDKTVVYLIENDKYFSNDIYAGDNNIKFLFFSIACLYSLSIIDFSPNIFHCHDYQTGIIPFLIKQSRLFLHLQNIKTIFTIHNLAYQGSISTDHLNTLKLISLPSSRNIIELGIDNSDAFTTVSPTYANEIKTTEYGAGLEQIIINNQSKLYGIINGIDYDFFNPETDNFIANKFNQSNLQNKKANKKIIQEKFNLPCNENIAVIGLVSRIVEQKGFDLFDDTFSQLNCQFIILGTGNETCQNLISNLQQKFPQQFAYNFSFDEELAHHIYAGCDIFAMPSQFEPCGLGQMIAMRYGAIPVVRKIGGLADTVNDSNGFSFKNYSSEDFFNTLKIAIDIFYNKREKWSDLQISAINTDFSWSSSAQKYLTLYQNILKHG